MKEGLAIFFQIILLPITFMLAISASPRLLADSSTIDFSEVAPGIYLHRGRHEEMQPDNLGDIANIGFIVGSRSVAVIDPGGSPKIGQAMRRAIEATTDLPVSHVIFTHIHPDHIFGSSAFADIEKVLAHRNFVRALVQRGDFYRKRFSLLLDDIDISPYLKPTVNISDKIQIDLGGRLLTIRAHKPAHTDHDLSIFDESSKTLWASDLIFSERIPSLDGSLSGWLQVMNALETLQPALVIPGHGKPGGWQTVSGPQHRYLTSLITQTRVLLDKNKRLSDVLEMVAGEERNKWKLFELHHRGNVTRAYTELEWE